MIMIDMEINRVHKIIVWLILLHKQEPKAETLLCLPTLKAAQSIKFCVCKIYWAWLLFIAFCAFALLAIFLYFWKARLAITVGFLVLSEVPIVAIQCDPGAGYGSWFHKNIVKTGDFVIVGNLTRTTKYY